MRERDGVIITDGRNKIGELSREGWTIGLDSNPDSMKHVKDEVKNLIFWIVN